MIGTGIAGKAGAGVRDVGDLREQKIWVMRHGEREDEVNDAWAAESERPYDPPLTSKGRGQVRLVADQRRLL